MIHFYNRPVEDMPDIISQKINEWGSKKILVMEDGNHRTAATLKNLKLFSRFVSKGSYMIVQDTKVMIKQISLIQFFQWLFISSIYSLTHNISQYFTIDVEIRK